MTDAEFETLMAALIVPPPQSSKGMNDQEVVYRHNTKATAKSVRLAFDFLDSHVEEDRSTPIAMIEIDPVLLRLRLKSARPLLAVRTGADPLLGFSTLCTGSFAVGSRLPELRLSLQYACILTQSVLMHLPMAFCAELGTAVKIKAARTAEQ